MHDYPGNPATWPANVGLIDDSDAPAAANFDVAPTNLADRTAWLKANAILSTGGTINSGVLEITASGVLQLDGGGNMVVAIGSTVEYQSGAFLQLDSGAQQQVLSGGQIQLQGALGVRAQAAQAVLVEAVGGIEAQADFGIRLGGSPANNVAFKVARDRTVLHNLIPQVGPSACTWSGWTGDGGYALQGGATVNEIVIPFNLHDGATLGSVVMVFVVTDPHTAGYPLNLPTMSIRRQPLTGVLGAGQLPLAASDPQPPPTPVSGSAWYDGANYKSWAYVCTQYNIIDRSSFVYYLVLTDETGTNAKPGNIYVVAQLNYNQITDARFP